MKDRIIAYWSDGSHRYNRSVHGTIFSPSQRARWQRYLGSHLGEGPHNILDIGTGPGVISIALADMGHTVTAVDLSDEMLARAKENAEHIGVDIAFRKGDAENLPFEDNSFDVVVNRWVLWTIPSPDKALSEWYRVLKPGGRVLYIDGNWYSPGKTPYQNAWKQFSNLLTAVTEMKNPWKHDYRKPVIQELWSTHASRPDDDINLCKKAGFTNVSVSRDVNEHTLTMMEYLKMGYYGPVFLVSGRKGE